MRQRLTSLSPTSIVNFNAYSTIRASARYAVIAESSGKPLRVPTKASSSPSNKFARQQSPDHADHCRQLPHIFLTS